MNIPGTESRIELYAMNTVCWTPLASVFAVGRLDEATLTEFRQHVESRHESDRTPHFRILATHHPIAFPYLPEEKLAISPSPWPSAMQLQKAAEHIRFFTNEGRKAQLGPLVHLFLSGHTHAGYPGGPLPAVVSEIYQGQLHRYQMQLVVGPLMLNKSRKPEHRLPTRTVDGYGECRLNLSNCQAQILQFFSDPDIPGELTLFRIPVVAISGID